MDDLKKKLDDELSDQLDVIHQLEPGTESHTKASESFEGLYKLKLEQEKLDLDADEKAIKQHMEMEAAEDQKKARLFDRIAKVGTDIAGIVLPLGCYAVLFFIGLDYEEEGSITSSFVKGLTQTIRPKK